MTKKKLYWICQLGGWLIFVLFQCLFAQLNNTLTISVAISQIIQFTFGVIISHLYRGLIIQFGWLRLNTLLQIPLVIISCLLLAILHDYGQFGLESLINIAGNRHFNNVIIASGVLNLAFVYFLWSLIYFLFHFIQNYKKAEIENFKWQASINEIELNKLKSQLNPHFMFNAMNSIRALVDENPLKSKEAITQLSNLLRNTLQMGKNKVITFNEEMKIVNDYLALESVRYEERLKIKMQIQKGSSDFEVPPLMIQTLVENGIKHGISKLTEGGMIEITTRVEKDKLIIIIRNSGQIKENMETDSGFGIKNTLQRLKLLYGNEALLKIANQDSNTVITELIIPKNMINHESNNN